MNAIVKFVKFLEKNLFRSFENGVAASQARVPALDTLMSSCPDLHTLKVTFFFKIFLLQKYIVWKALCLAFFLVSINQNPG